MDTGRHIRELVRARDPDRYLASLYAPPAARDALLALHALDIEIAEVARTTTEPMLGQIRLAWWREQLQGLDAGAPSPQPTLAAIAAEVMPKGLNAASLERLEDANLALLEDDISTYADARASLFEAGVRLLVLDPTPALVEQARTVGTGWAIVDAARQGRSLQPADLVRAAETLKPVATPSAVRPLFALGSLAGADLAVLRAGRAPSARGTPGRQVRLLWSMITGR